MNNGGAGVNIYILDTGVNLSHEEFGGRASHIGGTGWSDFTNQSNVRTQNKCKETFIAEYHVGRPSYRAWNPCRYPSYDSFHRRRPNQLPIPKIWQRI